MEKMTYRSSGANNNYFNSSIYKHSAPTEPFAVSLISVKTSRQIRRRLAS